MTIRRDISTVAVALGAYLVASQVNAFAFTDTSIMDPAGAFVSPSALYSGKGKPRKENINALTGLFAGDSWSLLDRTNKPAESFNDVLFMLSADTRRRSGAWELNWDKPAFSPSMDFVLLLKGGKQWGAYLFQAGGITPDAQKLAGNFEISWVNKKGRTPKLRYASIYGRPAPVPPVVTNPVPVDVDIPVVIIDSPVVQPDVPVVETDSPVVQPDVPVIETDSPVVDSDTSPDEIDIPTVVNDTPPVAPTIPDVQTVITAVPDPNTLPTPGSLALITMAFGLAFRQLRRNNYGQA